EPGDAIIGAMETLRASGTGTGAEERAMLHFALAKAHDDIGDYDKAFADLAEANAGARAFVSYDETADRREFDRYEAQFSAPFIAAHAGAGFSSELPIFITGFPRSGTTLTEQIFASLPAVHGAGEIAILQQILEEGGGMPELDGPDLQRLGALYVEQLSRLAPNSSRITDKNPDNGRLLRLIHLKLPT